MSSPVLIPFPSLQEKCLPEGRAGIAYQANFATQTSYAFSTDLATGQARLSQIRSVYIDARNLKNNLLISFNSLQQIQFPAGNAGYLSVVTTMPANITISVASSPDGIATIIFLNYDVEPFFFLPKATPAQQMYYQLPWAAWACDPFSAGTTPLAIATGVAATNLANSITRVRTAPNPVFLRYNSSAAANTGCQTRVTVGQGGNLSMPYGGFRKFVVRMRPTSLTSTRYWILLNGDNTIPFNSLVLSNQPNTDLLAWRYSPNAGDTTWKIICQKSLLLAQPIVDTGIPPDLTNAHTFEIRQSISGNIATFSFYYDNVFVTSFSGANNASVPPWQTSTFIDAVVQSDNQGVATAISHDFQMMYYEYSLI